MKLNRFLRKKRKKENARGTYTFTKRCLQTDMTFYIKTEILFPSLVQHLSGTLSLPSFRQHSLSPLTGRPKTHARPVWVEKSGRISHSVRSEIRAGSHARPDLRFGQISCRDTHARQISPAARDPAFSNPDPADRPSRTQIMPETHPYRRRSLSSSSPAGSTGLVGRGRGWPVRWITGSVWIQPEWERVFLSYVSNFVFDYFCIKLTWSLI